jgi:hypothetical protein
MKAVLLEAENVRSANSNLMQNRAYGRSKIAAGGEAIE